ncbi:MAG: tetratricopeptide repeat protein, partial [Elusimicrobiaceae bacterium]|nr:tetratricopeptide repeat protein [Elusimicrobiaceae bacterium]
MHRLTPVLLVSLLLSAPYGLGAEQDGALQTGLAAVSAAVAKKDYPEADSLLARLTEQFPGNPQLRGLRGVVLAEMGPAYAARAAALLEPSAELFPQTAQYRAALCRAYTALGGEDELEKAVSSCKQALALEPDSVDTALLLAQAYGAQNKYRTAFKYFRRVKSARPQDFRALYGLGRGYLARNNPRKALAELTLAEHNASLPSWKATAREQAQISLAVGDAYAALGNRKAALQSYDSAAETCPVPEIAALAAERAENLPRGKQTNASLSDLDRHDRLRELQRNPKNPEEIIFTPARVVLTDRQKADFRNCVKAAARLFTAKDNSAAAEKYRACLQIQPGDANARISLAGVLLLLNRLGAAHREFERGMRLLPPDSPMIGYCRSRQGDIEMKRARPEKAAEYYRQAIAIDPTEVNALVGLGRYHEENREWNAAHDAYQAGLTLEPANAAANEGLRRVEPLLATDTEILAELKLRRALPESAVTLAPADRETFRLMHKYEAMRAIDYLERRLKFLPGNYTVTKGEKAPEFRLLLSQEGFNAYIRVVTNELLKKLESDGVRPRAIFTVTDKYAAPVFDERGLITEPGMEVFYASLISEKAYYLPQEAIPDEVLAAMSPDEVTKLQYRRKGYDEVTGPEVQWLADITRCPQDVLEEKLDLTAVAGQNDTLYFLPGRAQGTGNGMLQNLLARYREGDARLLKKAGPEVTPLQTPIPLDYEAICDSGGSVKKLKTGFDQPEETEPRTLMSPAEPQISISSEPTANELDP